jgi:hypothetical protein
MADKNDEGSGPDDPNLKRRRLIYVLGEALDKSYRLREILKSQQIFITAQHQEPEPASAVDTLSSFLDRHSQTIFDSADLISLLFREIKLNEAQEAAILAAIQIFITSILQVHEMLLLLPRESAKPQAAFLLKDCFGCSDLGAAIVLTNFISAYEYRFEDILKQVNVYQEERKALTQGGNVLCQAFADKDNPLAWAVLAHEYGHVIDDRNTITAKVLPDRKAPSAATGVDKRNAEFKAAIDEQIVAETVADFVAAHVLGPASLMPILFVEMMYPRLKKVERISVGHPPTPLRVMMVRDYLKSLGVSTTAFETVFQTYELDYSLKLKAMEKADRETIEMMGSEAEKLLVPLTGAISTAVNALGLRHFKQENIEAAGILQGELAAKRPISSRRKRSDEEILRGLGSLKTGDSTPEQVYEVIEGLDEIPVPASEIITAGWLYKLSSLEGELKKLFPENVRDNVNFRGYAEYVHKTDGMLVKSLELADVHAEVLGRVTNI